ncbi:hypothetical protein BGZ60DRAFT_530278 [Tricladium varicosporioides]|nr:hypothetical protein BGZ60DRAFT_530278 [Hymenoscyphus varicosporioides]
MDESPSKRRKTSPTTSISIDVPVTPSRIPVLRRDVGKTLPDRPSFASPTRASIARHNPQLLNRPSSAGVGADRPSSRGRNLDGLFAKALGEPQTIVENQSSSQEDGERASSQGVENQTNNGLAPGRGRGTTPKKGTAVRGGMTQKPRRMSLSPVKQRDALARIESGNGYGGDMQNNPNPFQKKGLRRSPISSQPPSQKPSQEPPQFDSMPNVIDPFRKTGLRRSPIASNKEGAVEERPQTEELVVRKSALRRSPITSQAMETVQETTISYNQPTSTTPTGPLPLPLPPPILTMEPALLGEQQLQEELRQTVEELETPPSHEPSESIGSDDVLPQEAPEHRTSVSPIIFPVLPQVQTSVKPLDVLIKESLPRSHPDEPVLPPTPTQRGLFDPIVTTPPSGIHDTPSKRVRRNRVLGQKLKSSPLKPQDERPSKLYLEAEQDSEPRSQRPVKADKPTQPKKPADRRKSARFLIPEDPHAAQKKTRDELLTQLQQLQADVALANQENERLRYHHESKKRRTPAAPNADELLDLILRSTEIPAKAKAQPTSIFKSIGSFLPFSSKRKPTKASVADPDKPLPSHLPILLDDPFPYLQAFSPLKYTSTITLVPAELVSTDSTLESADKPIFQKHLIHASHPSGLFIAKLSMLVNPSTLSIVEIEIPKLDSAAEKELGQFVRKRVGGEGPLRNDISAICWAMGRWTEVASKRARAWCTLEEELCSAEAREITLQKSGRGKKRKRHGSAILGEDGGNEAEISCRGLYPTTDILHHIGRTSMEISDENVEILFEWKIGFDWTGEAESELSASARSPKSWQESDDRNSLAQIPNMFNRLVKESGPLVAMRAVVGLLMPVS